MRSEHFFATGLRRQRGGDPTRDVIGVVKEGARRGKNPSHGIVVALRDWIELMIVASRTANGLAEKCAAHRLQLLVNDIEAELLLVLLLVIGRTERKKGRGDQ